MTVILANPPRCVSAQWYQLFMYRMFFIHFHAQTVCASLQLNHWSHERALKQA